MNFLCCCDSQVVARQTDVSKVMRNRRLLLYSFFVRRELFLLWCVIKHDDGDWYCVFDQSDAFTELNGPSITYRIYSDLRLENTEQINMMMMIRN